MSRPEAGHGGDGRIVRLSAALVAVVFSLVALPFGVRAIGLVRDQLHIHCSWIEAEAWACADGIGYLGFGLFLAAMWLLTAVCGPTVAVFVRDGRDAGNSLVAAAAVSAGWILGATFLGAVTLVRDERAPGSTPEAWITAVGPSAILTVVAVVAAVCSRFLEGVVARVLLIAGALLICCATVLEPGLGINLLPAAGLLIAAVMHSTISTLRRPGIDRRRAG